MLIFKAFSTPMTVLNLTQQLINQASITPDDGGCLKIIEDALTPYGFCAEYFNKNHVKNLYLKRGTIRPLTVFVGHVDVVPTGPLEQWTSPPFCATEREGYLYGRGSADMKSGIAAFIVALQRFITENPDHPGSLALLITSDEEGPSIDGVRHVMEIFKERGEQIDYCLVGEPSSNETLGDTIKIGRRGSLSATLTVHGKQGHIAYPHLADNPIHRFAPLLQALTETTWDNGHPDFEATSCQFSNLHAGTGAANVIPGDLSAEFNFRYSPSVTAKALQQRVEALVQTFTPHYTIKWRHSGDAFLSPCGPLRLAAIKAIHTLTGLTPLCSTGGGTSDGRFIAPTGAEVIEVGVINKTIHQIDECVKIDDLNRLTTLYFELLKHLL